MIPVAEAQQTRAVKTPGVRRQRMAEFDTYVQALLDHPTEAVVYEDLGEAPQRFVLSLRGAFKRAGVAAQVRKQRGRDEVRAWQIEPVAVQPSDPEPTPMARGRRRRQS